MNVRLANHSKCSNNTTSHQRINVAPVSPFHHSEPTLPISTFVRPSDSSVVIILMLRREKMMNIDAPHKSKDELRPADKFFSRSLQARSGPCFTIVLPNLKMEGDVLVARPGFYHGEKPAMSWRRSMHIVKTNSVHVHTVEELRNGDREDNGISRLKFYSGKNMNKWTIFSQIVNSEKLMPLASFLLLKAHDNKLKGIVHWFGLQHSEDIGDAHHHLYKNVPEMLPRFLDHKNAPQRFFK